MATKMTLEKVKAEVRKMDPNLDSESSSFRAAVVLLAGLVVGANADSIAEFTGYSRAEVRKFGSNLRECGVWRGSKTACGWDDPESGGVAFWMDVCVAEGTLRRSK